MPNEAELFEKYKNFYMTVILDENKDLIFFPSGYKIGKDGNIILCQTEAVPPHDEIISLKYPYSSDEIKDALTANLLLSGKYECWDRDVKRKPWEAGYYKTRSFKAAIKGRCEIAVFADNMSIRHAGMPDMINISYMWPCKGSYQLYDLEQVRIEKSEGFSKAAEIILGMAEKDFTKTDEYKTAKNFLLI